MSKFLNKKIAYFLLICLTLVTGSIKYNVFAATNTWEFDNSGDYTLSNSTSFIFSGSIANLNQNSLVHQGKINNATNYDGAYDVVVDGNYAYMTSYLGDRVNVLNISNPSSPTLVGSILDGGTVSLNGAAGIVKDGNYLYVASNVSDAIQIIDVSNPASPSGVGRLVNGTTLNGARGIAKSGNNIFVACDSYDALQIINVSNVTNPYIVGTYRNAANGNLNGARDVKVFGNYAYVANYDRDSLAIINISNTTSPTFASELRQTTRLNGAHHVEISGNYAYVSAYLNNSVMVININNPLSQIEVTNISGGSYSLTNPRDLLVNDNKLYITSYGLDTVNVADITDPSNPIYITKIVHNAANPLLDGADGLFKVGNYIYVASYLSDALEILKLNYDTTSPTIIPNTGFNYGIDDISSLSDILGTSNQGTITYQISKDNGTTWYYWNGSSWATTTLGVTNSNSLSVINSNLFSFNSISGTGVFKFKAFFNSNGDQKVELDNFTTNTILYSPGGVSTDMKVWLKADDGTSTTVSGNSLSTWYDQSGNGINATAGVAPIYLNSDTENLNFNPIIDFNGTTQYMTSVTNGAYSQSYFAVIIPDTQIDGTQTGQVPFSIECNASYLNTGTCGLPFGGLTLGAFTIAMNDEVITHAIGASDGWRSAQIGTASYESGKPMLVHMNENSSGNGTEISEKGSYLDNYNANTYQTLSATNYRLGRSLDSANVFPYDGKIAEIINFSSRVSPTDKVKIESYLSLKYGITLNSGTQNYIASDGTTNFWTTSNAGTYIYSIFGIGRDDSSELSQVKSKSVNNSSVITLEAIGEGTNLTPSFVDIGDKEFLTISNNNLGNTWTATNSPTGYYILSRAWRVQETGEVGTVNLDFDVNNSNFDIPALSTGTNYYFLYDINNNDSLTDDTPIAMTNTSGSIWRASGINLNNLREFSIATQASSNHIPTNISLSNSSINENVSIGTLIGILSTTDADSLDSHTYTLVSGAGDDDNGSVSITGNNIYIQESPDYEIQNTYSIRIQTDDGNGGQYQKQFNINVNNIGEVTDSIINFEQLNDETKYTVTSGTWTRNTVNPYEGSYSIQSSNAGNNTQSCFEVINTFSATGSISFNYYVSSQANSDYLRFYLDNVEQQAWSGTVPWATYINNSISAGTHSYKWCFIKDGSLSAGTDNSYIDYITFDSSITDITAPVISGTNYNDSALLPGGNHNMIINYSDADTGININSDTISLYKWNGTSWGSNISTTGFNLSGKIVTSTSATYPTNNLLFGKYRYDFQISDNSSNTGSISRIFYIDEPELIISTGSLDIGKISSGVTKFSTGEITLEVKTLGAGFDLILNKTSALLNGTLEITDWNGTHGVGYDNTPYSSTIKIINLNQIIASQSGSINTNGEKNSYIYGVKLGALVGPEQAAGYYNGNLSFGLNLDY